MVEEKKLGSTRKLNKRQMGAVSLNIKSMVAGELLSVADELNQDSMALVERLVQQHAQQIERNL